MVPPLNPIDSSLPKTYAFSRKWKTIFWFLGPLGAGFFGFAAAYFVLEPGPHPNLAVTIILVCMALGMTTVFAIGFLEVMHCTMTIHPDRIHFVEVYGEREFLLSNVEGYRVKPQGQGVYLVLKDKPNKKVTIPSNLADFPEIIQWLDAHFRNLDAIDYKAEEEKILEDTNLGATPYERKEKLQRTKVILKNLRWVSLAVMFWVMIYPQPYELAIAVGSLLPLAGIVLVVRSHGVIHVDEDAKGAHPSAVNLLMPAAAVAFRAFLDFNVLDYNDVWVPAGTVLALLAVVVYWNSREYRARPLQFLPILLFLSFLSYGVTIQVNCLLDNSAAKVHTPRVLSKRTSTDKPRLYYFRVTSWGQNASDSEIQVSSAVYKSVNIGDTVRVHEKEGLVDIRWFYTRPLERINPSTPVTERPRQD